MNAPLHRTTAPPSPLRSLLRAALDGLPTLAVLALLGAIGWYGHTTGWKLPKFSQLRGVEETKDDWCPEHSVPESVCIECDDTLMPKGKAKGWCKVHGIPECVVCNPKLAQLVRTPGLSSADLELAERGLNFAERPENNPICDLHKRRIQFVDAAAVDKAGVVVETVRTAPALEFVTGPGEIGFDRTRVSHLSSRASGTVRRVSKRIGETVEAGEVLAVVDAAEVAKAKTELFQAVGLLQLRTQTLTRLKGSADTVPEGRTREVEAAVREAEIRVSAARQMLVNFGLPADTDAKPDPQTASSGLLPLIAPMAGVVTSCDIVVGEVVDGNRVLFEVVDTRHLWLTFDIRAEDARRVKVGQKVRFRPDGDKEELAATLSWISTQADPKTRTVRVRADLADPEARLKANTFGAGRVILREEAEVVTIPNEAIQSEGCCQIVFVRDKNFLKADYKVFHVRKIRTAARTDTASEVVGVLPGELVVTTGSGLLLTELLRGSLGDGCACCHPKK